MSRLRGRKAWTWIACVVVGITIGAAGVTRSLRDRAADRVADLELRLSLLQQRMDLADDEEGPVSAERPDAPRTSALLEGPDVVETMQELQQLADGAAVSIDDLRAMPAIERGRQGFEVVGVGTPQALSVFLAAIEKSERLMIVENGRIAAHDEESLGFTLGVATYHHEQVVR